QRARRVVEARVNHAAVVGGRLEAGLRVALDHADFASADRDRARGGETDESSADDDDHWLASLLGAQAANCIDSPGAIVRGTLFGHGIATRTHYRHHRPGRVVPRRTAA